MPAKKKVRFLIALLLLSTVACSVEALPDTDTTVIFHGVGVTVNLTFLEEAHPSDSITHNLTINANVALTLQNFTIIVEAPVSTGWQEVKNQTITFLDLLENQNLTSSMKFTLPPEANGALLCYMYIQTDQSGDYSSYTFYTTRVSELTFSEMQSLYDEMLANYTALQEVYATLLNEYNGLLANYTSLFNNYTALVSNYDTLYAQYNAKVSSYQTLSDTYNKLLSDNNALSNDHQAKVTELDNLQAKYDELNTTRYSLQGNYTNLQGNYTSLQTDYNTLNQIYTDLLANSNHLESDLNSDKIVMVIFIVAVACLVAFIVYLKWRKQEPYVVIRKETVSVNQDENAEAS